MPANTTGAALKALREAHGLTQQQLATQLGTHTSTVSAWEQSRNRPSRDSVLQLETALGLNGQLLTAFAYAGVTPYDQLHADVADLKAEVAELKAAIAKLTRTTN